MSEDDRIDKLIESLENLVKVETARRNERDEQRAKLRSRVDNRPEELEKAIPRIDVAKIEDDSKERQAKVEQRMRDALEREQLLLSNLARQTELLEEIVAKLEAKP